MKNPHLAMVKYIIIPGLIMFTSSLYGSLLLLTLSSFLVFLLENWSGRLQFISSLDGNVQNKGITPV